MTPRPRSHRCVIRHSQESGYAYLMALFMILIVIIGSTVVLENAATQTRRAREDEMVWRGKQYIRAIKQYYRKTGRYPQDLDTLEKGVANIHFLREYPDPMNKDKDGKWRFIYTNASGAIIGSVRYATMQQMAILELNGGVIPGASDANVESSNVTPVAQPDQGNCTTPVGGTTGDSSSGSASTNSANPQNPNQSFGGQPSQGPLGAQPGAQPNGAQPATGQAGCPQPNANQQTGMSNQPSSGLFGGNAQSQNGIGQFNPGASQVGTNPGSAFGLSPQMLQTLAQMKPTGPVDSPVIGGLLVGVGSTVDAKSIRVYKGGKKYKDWEFIWNPLEDQARAIQQGMNQAGFGGLGGAAGMQGGQPGNANGNGFGSGFGAQPGPSGSTPSPGQTPTTPQQPQ